MEKKLRCKDLIAPDLIAQHPTLNPFVRGWLSRISECKWVEDYFAFLNKQMGFLDPKGRKNIIRRIVSTDDKQYHEAVAELVYIAFWNYLKWPFEKDPKIDGNTPDFKLFYDNSPYAICDVTVARLSKEDNKKYKPITPDELKRQMQLPQQEKEKYLPIKPIEQSHRFLIEIDDKLDKYSKILANIPFVVCFYIYDSEFYLDDFQISNALFGDLTANFDTGKLWHQPKVQTTKHSSDMKQGIFGFEEYKPLAAVIICKQEFCPTSLTKIKEPKPHLPLKAKFSFSIYANPLGEWTNKHKNPFLLSGLSVNGLINKNKLGFCNPNVIEFY